MEAQAKDRALAVAIWGIYEDRSQYAKEGSRASFTVEDARTLRRAQLTLRRWAEEMCNGTIQREGEQGDGRPFRVYPDPVVIRGKVFYREPVRPNIPDREAGALRRVEQVCKAAGLHYYHQTDPRGCALYVSTEPLNSQNYSSKGVPCL
mgnify:CR=1 FL=1